ncbi:hypothetical protein QU481_01990 [Crenobacter sp. SG2303]|uniref:Major facilitator superfamily (MFS) profile domain-containing protein n=1 Tax=Crenobacter oryzisoli TaxID=3056844 RepID=A0ABT7XIQ1_9NEIS|nr:hypothetical protein [Crenobacter sp. SG2303]MDN0073664.1 hypothetical protein [Crenobacter sp. SG2303]
MLAIILVSYLMTILDVSIVITALPKIERSPSFWATKLTWVQSAYPLTFGGVVARRSGRRHCWPTPHVRDRADDFHRLFAEAS